MIKCESSNTGELCSGVLEKILKAGQAQDVGPRGREEGVDGEDQDQGEVDRLLGR